MSRLPVERLRPLDPSSGVPRYRQIADQIAVLISDAEPGVRLPSEHEMAAHLGVSRATAIQALKDLENRGLVHRRQGRGSFTADTDRAIRTIDSSWLPSFSDDLSKAGRSTSEQVLLCSIVRAPAEVSSALELAPDTQVWQIARVIYSDDEPVIHATSWLSMRVYPEIDMDEIESSSLYRYLQARYGTAARPSTAEEQWTAQAALRPIATALAIPAGAPVMRVQRRALLADGIPVEYALSYVRAETFAVSFRIVNSNETGSRVATVEAEVL
ncbi:MAG TPA: GntR family transcriptional regulator [Streptosporangiaceae bacterium]